MSIELVPDDQIFLTKPNFIDPLREINAKVSLIRANPNQWGKVITFSSYPEALEAKQFTDTLVGIRSYIEVVHSRSGIKYTLWLKATKESSKKADDYEPKVAKLCEALAERVQANGFKVNDPLIPRWLKASKSVFDRAEEVGSSDERVFALVDWATSDSFWKDNIRSMPKFAEKYDQLRLRANQSRNTKPSAKTTAINDVFGD